MNERIKELAEQAGSTHKQSLGVYQFYTYELEKFAVLIAKDTLKTFCQLAHIYGIDQSNNPAFYKVMDKVIQGLEISNGQ